MAVTLPTTPLAAQADLDALAARVAKLEGGTPPGPTPGQPSKTGTYLTQAGEPAIVDDALNLWSLVATNVATKGQQIAVQRAGTAPPAMIDAVTANVVKLGMDLVAGKRQVVQQNQAGAFYTSTAPFSPWQQITGPDGYQPPPIPAGSIFKVSGGKFHKPDGSVFQPTGVDIWWTCFSTRDGGVGQGSQIISDWNTGAPLLTAFPDLSIIRLACFMDGNGLGGYPTVAELTQLVNFCTAHRIVLLIDPHDYSGGDNWVLSYADGSLNKAIDFLKTHGAAWKDKPYVWCQTQNEPGTPNADEINGLYDAWRGAGNESPILLGWVTYDYLNRVDRGITERMHNVGIDVHRYAMSAGSSNMKVQDHIDTFNRDIAALKATFRTQDGEIPVGTFEFGDACCGHVEPAGQVCCEAVCKSNADGWSIWNWCTAWNGSWGHDVINQGNAAVNAGLVVKPYMRKG